MNQQDPDDGPSYWPYIIILLIVGVVVLLVVRGPQIAPIFQGGGIINNL